MTQSQKNFLRLAASYAFFYSGAFRLAKVKPALFGHTTNWTVLTYHRVINPEEQKLPPQPGMYVRGETLDKHLAFLKQHARLVHLEDLLNEIDEGREIPPGTVALTFDDGWIDTYTTAFPLLKKWQIPATVFLPTAFIGSKDCFWTDKLAGALKALSEAPQYKERALSLLSSSFPDFSTICEQCKCFVEQGACSAEALDTLIEMIKTLPLNKRRSITDKLLELAKEFTTYRQERLFMNWEEAREMSLAGIRFASHSHHHHNMSELSLAHLDDEIANSYQMLKTQGLNPLNAFCYPGGYYNKETQLALANRKIKFAITCQTQALQASALCPTLIGRTQLHEDISYNLALFVLRIWGP